MGSPCRTAKTPSIGEAVNYNRGWDTYPISRSDVQGGAAQLEALRLKFKRIIGGTRCVGAAA